jgi:hypothetical protein
MAIVEREYNLLEKKVKYCIEFVNRQPEREERESCLYKWDICPLKHYSETQGYVCEGAYLRLEIIRRGYEKDNP